MISKKAYPPELKDAERKVEAWWAGEVRRLAADPATATLVICRAMAAGIARAGKGLLPGNPSMFHALARSHITGSQFALQSVTGRLPLGEFPSTFVLSVLPQASGQAAAQVINEGYQYSLVRDAYITFRWGGYDVQTIGADALRFTDVAGWDGARDHASRALYQEVDRENAALALPRVVTAGRPRLDQTYQGPGSLTFLRINAEQFSRGWSVLCEEFARDVFTGDCRILTVHQLATMVTDRAGLAREAAEEFISLISFDRSTAGALTLFHCPLVPVTSLSRIVVAPALTLANLTTCINRLAVHRGPGLDSMSKALEEYHLSLIKQNYEATDVVIRTNVPYTHHGISRDIDLALYENRTGRLHLGMLKGFVRPDSVEEVIRANEQLAYGIQQAVDVRDWINGIAPERRAVALGLPRECACQTIHCAVFGNGFAGSDYLSLDPGIPVVDSTYILLPRFRGRSLFDSISEYASRLAEFATLRASSHPEPVRLGNITFELPAFVMAADTAK